MFDKFFTMNKGEVKKVLTAPYGDVMQITIVGVLIDSPELDKAAYVVEVVQNNVKETSTHITVPLDQILKLELKDGESLTIEAYYDDIDFHINGRIYKVT